MRFLSQQVMVRIAKIFGFHPSVSESTGNWVTVGRAQSSAGVAVTEDTALTYSAVYAAIRVISESVASLGWNTYQTASEGSTQRVFGGRLDYVLNEKTNAESFAFNFRSALVGHLLTQGNGYAEIEWRQNGEIEALHLISPQKVIPTRDKQTRRMRYFYLANNGQTKEIPSEDLIHWAGLGFDGISGYNVIDYARESIGLGLATERHGATFFGNDARPGLVLEHQGKLSAEAQQRLREYFSKSFSRDGAWKPWVAEEGLKVHEVGFPNDSAQFLETRAFNVKEIARWFGVPPHKLGDLERSTYSNIEHQNMEYVQDTILPWAKRLEQPVNDKLLTEAEKKDGIYTKLNIDSLLRADGASRAARYNTLIPIGVMTINEARRNEGLAPVDGGDIHFVPLNMTTLDRAGEPVETEENKTDMQEVFLPLLENAFGLLEAKIAKGVEQYAGRDDEAEKMEGLLSRVRQQYVREIGALCIAMSHFNGIKYDIEKMALGYCSASVRDAVQDSKDIVAKLNIGRMRVGVT